MRTVAIASHLQEQGENPPDFDQLARVYRWMEWLTFGPFLQRCRCAFLPTLGQRRNALILGDGDGRFTARLLKKNPAMRVHAVDASKAMLRQLARRSPLGCIHIHIADARTFSPPRRDHDLIATHFFLDCLSDAEVIELALRLRKHACPDAVWIVSEFAIPANLYGRAIVRPLVSLLYLAFGILTNLRVRRLPAHRSAFALSGWSLRHRQKFLAGLLVSEMWKLDSKFELAGK